MNQLIYNQNDRLLPWASERIGFSPRADAIAVGWGTADALRAVVVYDNFSASDVNIHLGSDGSRTWMSKTFLFACFAHPFNEWGMRRLTALVPSKNRDAIAFNLHCGYRWEGFIRHAMPDDDLVILGMLRSECRFISEKHRNLEYGR